MKVRVNLTVEADEDQLRKMADLIYGHEAPAKRRATRDEAREMIWSLGSDWEAKLTERWDLIYGEPKPLKAPELSGSDLL